MPFPASWTGQRSFGFSQRTAFREARAGQRLDALVEAASAEGGNGDALAQFRRLEDEAEEGAAEDAKKWSGVCDGFCLVWMKAKLLHSLLGAPALQAIKDRETKVNGALRAATDYHDKWAPGPTRSGEATPQELRKLDGEGEPARYLKMNKMPYSMGNGRPPRWASSLDDVVAMIAETAGRCIELNFSVPKEKEPAGNHAIAFYRSHGGNIYCFDPNYGEYKIPRRLFRNFLSDLLAAYSSSLTFQNDAAKIPSNAGDATDYNFTLRRWFLDTPRKPTRQLRLKNYGV